MMLKSQVRTNAPIVIRSLVLIDRLLRYSGSREMNDKVAGQIPTSLLHSGLECGSVFALENPPSVPPADQVEMIGILDGGRKYWLRRRADSADIRPSLSPCRSQMILTSLRDVKGGSDCRPLPCVRGSDRLQRIDGTIEPLYV
jgi:hypothetical protein